MFSDRLERPRSLHRLEQRVELATTPEELFAFHADPANLDEVSPPWVRTEKVGRWPDALALGATFDLRIKTVGPSFVWRTEVIAWEPPHRFVDIQRRGPFRWFEHEHRLDPVPGGTLLTDTVLYAVPPIPGLHRFKIRPDLERMFAYRRSRYLERFGAASG